MNNCKDIRHDLVQLDWPQGYIGANTSSTYHQNGCEQGDTCDATIIEYIKEIVKPLGDVAVMGEAYNPTDTPWAFMSVFDGVIDGVTIHIRITDVTDVVGVEVRLFWVGVLRAVVFIVVDPVEIPIDGFDRGPFGDPEGRFITSLFGSKDANLTDPRRPAKDAGVDGRLAARGAS